MNDWLLQEAREIRQTARQLLSIADDLEHRARSGCSDGDTYAAKSTGVIPSNQASDRPEPGTPEVEGEQDAIAQGPVRYALRIHLARRLRANHFPASLFAEPAWDMLVSLYVLRMIGRPAPNLAACLTTTPYGPTVMRWGKVLLAEGLVECRPSPGGIREPEYRLSDQGLAAMERYFAELGVLSEPEAIPAHGLPG